MHTVRYTELSPERFRNFLGGLSRKGHGVADDGADGTAQAQGPARQLMKEQETKKIHPDQISNFVSK
jgi:hypothetical protein